VQNGGVIPYLWTETTVSSGGSNRRRLGGLGARVRRENGEEPKGISWGCSPTAGVWRGGRNPAGGGARGGRRLDFKGDGAPAFLRRRKAVVYVRLGVAVLLATLVGSSEHPRRRTVAAAGSAKAGSTPRREARQRQLGLGHARGLRRSSFISRGALDSLGAHAKDSRQRRPGRVRHGHWPRPGSRPGWAKADLDWAGGRDGSSLRARPR
jgi:hypothetical protein